MSLTATDEQINLFEVFCDDGVTYAVRVMAWNLDKIADAFENYMRHPILSDDIPKTLEAFQLFILAGGSIWFEVLRLDSNEQVGLIQINELSPSLAESRYISAVFHAITWDSKAAYRQKLIRKFIKWLFRSLRLHRLQAEIPPKFGGAIRTLIKTGFISEGRLRGARRYGGEWYDVVVLGLLETEVDAWEIENG